MLAMLVFPLQNPVQAAEPDYGFYQEIASVLPAGKLSIDVWNSSGENVHTQPSQLRLGLGRLEGWLTTETLGGKLQLQRHLGVFARAGVHSRRASISELGGVFSFSDRIGRVSLSGLMFERQGQMGMQAGGLAQMKLPVFDNFGPLYAMGELILRDHNGSEVRIAAGLRWVARQQVTVDMWLAGSHTKDNALFYALPAAVRVTLMF